MKLEDVLGARDVEFDGLRISCRHNMIDVHFGNGRSQSVRCSVRGEMLVFATTIASSDEAPEIPTDGLAEKILDRNGHTDIVTFGFDADDALVAWCLQPHTTLQRRELLLYLSHLAREADRVEFLLTGRDSN